jgi:hypothetical protein
LQVYSFPHSASQQSNSPVDSLIKAGCGNVKAGC